MAFPFEAQIPSLCTHFAEHCNCGHLLGSPPQVFPGASKELLQAPQIHLGCCLLPLSVPTGLQGAWLVLSAPAGTAVLLVTLYGSWIIVF